MLHSQKRQDPHATYLSQKETIKNGERWGGEKWEWPQEGSWRDDAYIFNLKQKIDEFHSIENENESNSKKLAKLYDLGIINEYGDPTDKFKNMS